jgi:hypothetical protein
VQSGRVSSEHHVGTQINLFMDRDVDGDRVRYSDKIEMQSDIWGEGGKEGGREAVWWLAPCTQAPKCFQASSTQFLAN